MRVSGFLAEAQPHERCVLPSGCHSKSFRVEGFLGLRVLGLGFRVQGNGKGNVLRHDPVPKKG